jgi:hypothetical protein
MSMSLNELLRALYSADENARALFDWAVDRQRDVSGTTVDRICEITAANRNSAVELAKKLDEIGCADFVVGRRGAKTRLEWKFSLKELGNVAAGHSNQLSPQEDSDEAVAASNLVEMRSYRFPLRSDLEISVSIPVDLNQREAQRLANFLQTLAVE